MHTLSGLLLGILLIYPLVHQQMRGSLFSPPTTLTVMAKKIQIMPTRWNSLFSLFSNAEGSSPKKLISGTMYDLYVQPKHHYLHLVNGLVHHRSEFNFELLLMFRLKTAIPRGKKLEDHTMMEYREKLTLLDVQTIIFSWWVRFFNLKYTVKTRKLIEEKLRIKEIYSHC